MCIPVMQHPSKAALNPQGQCHSTSSDALHRPSATNCTQSARLLPQQYGLYLGPNLMRADAMYALSELFKFAACSESQFINFMRSHVEEALRTAERQQELSVANLRFNKDLLDQHIAYLQETIMCINDSGDARWPSASGNDHASVADVQKELLRDYQCLLRRVQDLATRCLDGTAVIVNSAMLQESRKAIDQAERVERLSILVFFFAPASLTCSVFGMNFVEFGQGQLNIYIFVPVLLPVLGIAAALCFWEPIARRLPSLRDRR